jgi:hypothetical protein
MTDANVTTAPAGTQPAAPAGSSPAAPASPASGGQPSAPASALQAEASKITGDPKSEFYTGTGPEHDRQVALVFAAKQEQFPKEPPAYEEPTSVMLQGMTNLKLPVQMTPKQMDADPELRQFVSFVRNENVDSHVATEMLGAWMDVGAPTRGQITQAQLDQLASRFKGRVHPKTAERLYVWMQANHVVKGR